MMKFLLIFVIFLLLQSLVSSTLQGPDSSTTPSDKTNTPSDRKSSKSLDEEPATTKTSDESYDETEKFVKIIANDLNFPSSGIKIVKAPDLSKDSDNKKIRETLANLLESQEKWIQQFEEELEEMEKQEVTEEEPVEKTPEEIEGELELLIRHFDNIFNLQHPHICSRHHLRAGPHHPQQDKVIKSCRWLRTALQSGQDGPQNGQS